MIKKKMKLSSEAKYIIIGILLLFILLWWTRFQIVSNDRGVAYQINRFTGRMILIRGETYLKIRPEEPIPKEVSKGLGDIIFEKQEDMTAPAPEK